MALNSIWPYQQLFRFKEVQRKTRLSDLWNAIHKEEKAMLEHTIRLHTRKIIYLNLSLVTCIIYVLSPCTVYIKLPNFILFSPGNDDMESFYLKLDLPVRFLQEKFITVIQQSAST